MTRRSTPRAMRRAVEQLEAAGDYLPAAVKEVASPLAVWRAARGPKSSYTEVLAREICERHANGETITAILRDAHLPKMPTVAAWLRARPDFAEAYKIAREEHDAVYGPRGGYTPEMGDEICRAVESGKTLAQICADPAMPVYETVLSWRKLVPEFQAAYLAAREASAEACEHNAIREVELAYDRDSAAVAKVRADVWKWAAGVRNPKTHGTKVEATVNVEIGLADRLNAAIGRVTGRVIEGVVVEAGGLGVGDGAGMGLPAPGEAQEGGAGASGGSGAG